MIMWKSISGSNDCLTYGSKLLMLVYCSCLMLLYGFRCYQFSVIYKLQNFRTPMQCWCGFDRGLIRYFAINRSFTFNPCVLQTISCLYHTRSPSLEDLLQILFQHKSWRLDRSGRNFLFRSKKHQNGQRLLLIITPVMPMICVHCSLSILDRIF